MLRFYLFLLTAAVLFFAAGCNKPTTTTPATSATPSQATSTPAATSQTSPTPAASPDQGDDSAASGEVVILEEVGVSYTIPAGWKKDADGNLETPDGELAVVFMQVEASEAQAALEGVAESLDTMMTDVEVTEEASEHAINGINSYSLGGSGKIEGKPIEWTLEVMGVKKPIIILGLAEAGALDKHADAFAEFEDSFTVLEVEGEVESEDAGGEADGEED
jgi:hypothetical protein